MRNMRDFNWIRPKGSQFARNASFSFCPCLTERKVGMTRVNNGAKPFFNSPAGELKSSPAKTDYIFKSFVA
jgi:hypothetical protein